MSPVRSWLERLWAQEKRLWTEAEQAWSDRRLASRQMSPPLKAYYWDGQEPVSHPVRAVSLSGMYLVTEQRWYPHTMVRMTLVRTDKADGDPGRSIEVLGRVARSGTDGVGLAFILHNATTPRNRDDPNDAVADAKTLREFLPTNAGAVHQTAA
jgi:hypothetical protein